MRVNSQTKVANLNSDLLDSKDSTGFVSSSIYTKVGPVVKGVANNINNTFLTCDDRDKMLSGGYTMIHLNGAIASGFDVAKDQVAVVASFPNGAYFLQWHSDATRDDARLRVTCADQ